MATGSIICINCYLDLIEVCIMEISYRFGIRALVTCFSIIFKPFMSYYIHTLATQCIGAVILHRIIYTYIACNIHAWKYSGGLKLACNQIRI